MTLKELRSLVKQGESESLEFKKKIADPLKILREMVAMANHKGGQLLVGVSDNGNISGLKYPEEEMYQIESVLSVCRPSLPFQLETISVDAQKSVLVYHIPSSPVKPHYLVSWRRRKPFKNTYIRVEDKSIKASREVVQILLRKDLSRGTYIEYGEKERILMQYLEEHQQITLNKLTEIASISRRNASETLIMLVLARVLRIKPQETADVYYSVN